MTPAFVVVEPGLFTTVQDLGRTGFQSLGIPVSGAIDQEALRIANIVVGNPQGTAGLEMALSGPTLEVEAESVRVAVVGGRASLAVEFADGSSTRIAAARSITLARGDRLRVGGIEGSAVAYLAIAGGLDLPPFMGSLSTYVRGGFGGLEGRPLRKGDRLALTLPTAPDRADMQLTGIELPPARTVRIVPGPQDDWFTDDAWATLLVAPYVVSRDADRMGLRLDGPELTHSKGTNMVSDGIAPGSIQVPGNGLPIVLLADRQTTGGYPKIATVASVDLPALGRVSPGAELRFAAVTIEEAEVARRDYEARLDALAGQLEPVGPRGPDLAALLGNNLISGVVDARGGEM